MFDNIHIHGIRLELACRHDGGSLDKARQALAGRPMAARAALVQLRGDWDWNCKWFGTPQWNEGSGMCWLCKAKPEEWRGMSAAFESFTGVTFCPLNIALFMWCELKQSRHMDILQSKQLYIWGLVFLHSEQAVLLSSLLCRSWASKLNKFLWKTLLGKRSKRFPSGKLTAAWHSGHLNFRCLWLTLACLSKHSQQSPRHLIVTDQTNTLAHLTF